MIGCGPGSMTMAVELGLKGYEIRICDMPLFDKNLRDIQKQGGIKVLGKINGFYKPEIVTTRIEEAIKGVDVIFINARAFGHHEIVKNMLPYLESGQMVISWTPYFFCLRFYDMVKKEGPKDVILAEGHILPYFTKIIAPATVEVYNVKKYLKIAAMPSKETSKVLSTIKHMFPACEMATNVLETSLDNFNFTAHVPQSLLNVGWWEQTNGDVEFYSSLVTPKVCDVMEAIDNERITVGKALGLKLTPHLIANNLAYGIEANSLYESFRRLTSHHTYRPKMSSNEFASRGALGEDLLYCFVPLSSIGDQLNMDTPIVDSLVNLACVILQRDYWTEGLTMEKIGLANMNVSQMINYVTNG